MNIREAVASDNEKLISMFKEHANYENSKLVICNQSIALSNIEEMPITLYVVERSERIIGYMSIVKQFSTWNMDYYLYLDCLYISSEYRGMGIGMKLMDKCRKIATQQGIKEVQWQTPSSNIPAICFYKKLGANPLDKQRFFGMLLKLIG